MAFFKSFQQNLPSVNISSILDSVSSRVDDLASAVSDVTYTVSDQLTEQVSTIINKVQEEEEDGGNASGQEANHSSAAQEGKASRKSTADHGLKNNAPNDTAARENAASQLEWEWRDGCWRVKKTEAELAEEEKRKKEAMEWEEKREQRRKERRERQLEKEAKSQRSKEQETDEAGALEETGSLIKENGGTQDRKASDSGDKLDAQHGSDNHNESPQSPSPETESRASKKTKEKEEGENEERLRKEEGDEGEAELSTSPSPIKKKKKSVKKKGKGAKEGSKTSEKASDKEKKKEKDKKSKKKKKKAKKEAGSSDSEEDRGPEAVAQQKTVSAWDNKRKQSTGQEGYSSEASSVQANSIQRKKTDSPLNELQPPPYQDKDTAACVSSRSRSGRGVRRGSSPECCDSRRCSSQGSVDHDTESYLNKGYEEDVPSDSTAVLGPEDGSQLPAAYEPEALGKYGTLDVAFEYDSGEQWLAVTVTAATDIPTLKQTGNISWQVHLVLLPTKKQRAKTGVQKGPCPVFTETFKFSRVEQEALGDYAVRFRLYSVRRMKKEKVLGEKVFYLTKLNLQGKMALPVTLEPGSELTGCGSLVSVSRSAGAVSYRSAGDSSMPEILLGLIYNAATGRLSAEVIQGSHFKNTASDKPNNGLFCCVKHFIGGQLYVMRDTYVKLTMLDSKGKEMSKCKTAVCRGQPNPTYKETFVFQVALFQLSEVSLVVSVFCRRSSMKPRERLGLVSLGLNSTGEEQQAHWLQMKEAEGQQVCHWHTLTDT
ncbi:synaptotagmin-14-like [Diretmus argenteus]